MIGAATQMMDKDVERQAGYELGDDGRPRNWRRIPPEEAEATAVAVADADAERAAGHKSERAHGATHTVRSRKNITSDVLKKPGQASRQQQRPGFGVHSRPSRSRLVSMQVAKGREGNVKELPG